MGCQISACRLAREDWEMEIKNIHGETVVNDLNDLRVGKVVNLDPCGLYKHSPKAKVESFLEFARAERNLPVDIREMANNMTNQELNETAEWLSDALSAVLVERNRRRGK